MERDVGGPGAAQRVSRVTTGGGSRRTILRLYLPGATFGSSSSSSNANMKRYTSLSKHYPPPQQFHCSAPFGSFLLL